jgi:hypothetical protein
MKSLAIAFADFGLPVQAELAPRMDALGRLLARGAQTACGLPGWRHWVLETAGVSPPRRLPLARTIADQAGNWAIATPVHLLAGLEHVHFDPTGLPQLSDDEWQQVAVEFNRVFDGDGLRLKVERGCALLRFDQGVDALTHDPLPLSGRDVGAWLPAGADGARLRRLMTEIQMWLHVHPLNEARGRDGQAPVNGLWIWGQGGDELPPVPAMLPRLAANDPFLRRYWESVGAPAGLPPASFEQWRAESPPAAIVALELAGIDRDPARALELAEERWFGPLEFALACGELSAARLFLDGAIVALRRSDRMRFWRPRRPWHEALR